MRPGWLTEEALAGFSGLRPRRALILDAEFAREEVKGQLLERLPALASPAVTTAEAIALEIAAPPGTRTLSATARIEALGFFLGNPRVRAGLPGLARLARARAFLPRLDRALQDARAEWADEAQAEALELRLQEIERGTGGTARAELRAECRAIAAAYEGWLEAGGHYDLPRALRSATRALREGTGTPGAERPRAWTWWKAGPESNLEAAFREELARAGSLEVLRAGEGVASSASSSSGTGTGAGTERAPVISAWHTWDDAAEALADRLAAEPARAQTAILLGGAPDARRALLRALADRGIRPEDPRDPRHFTQSEIYRAALRPLAATARLDDRELLRSAWLDDVGAGAEPAARLVAWDRRGETRRPGRPAQLGRWGRRLAGGRATVAEWAGRHLEGLKDEGFPDDAIAELEGAWNDWEVDLARLDQATRRFPLAWVATRLAERLRERPAPAPRERYDGGARIYRAGQAPTGRALARLWVFGVDAGADVERGRPRGDLWLSAGERERLAPEWGVRAPRAEAAHRLGVWREWGAAAAGRETLVFEAAYGARGEERPRAAPALFTALTGGALDETVSGVSSAPAHPRWEASRASLPAYRSADARVAVAPRPEAISATTIDLYGRCGFLGLESLRWRAEDQEPASVDLPASTRGSLLHLAARKLVASRDPATGALALSVADALELAWLESPPRGLLDTERVARLARLRLLPLLAKFAEEEAEYSARARPEALALDDQQLAWVAPTAGITLQGRPDRVDRVGDGIVLMDYKSSASGIVSGRRQLELGVRLQLPLYALAARARWGREVLAAIFVPITRDGGRTQGIVFPELNGSAADHPERPFRLDPARSRSLFKDAAPAEVWGAFADRLDADAAALLRGEFPARPRAGKSECAGCRLPDACGLRRRPSGGGEEVE